MVLVADAPWAVQEYDFQKLQWLWDGCRLLDRTEDRRAASCIAVHVVHRTDQRNHSAVQSPLQKSRVHTNWGTTADICRQRTHRLSERNRRLHYQPIITWLKWLLNLLLSWECCSCKRASELKKGITLAELCWSASVKAWQCFTIVVLAREDLVSVLAPSSSSKSGGNPITTTSFISILCKNESPKARLWTISWLSNTEVSTCRQSKNQLQTLQ